MSQAIKTKDSPTYFLVTTGLGRQSKAHIPGENGEALCGYGGDIMKEVNREVVEKFRDKCSKCQRLKEK